MDTRKLILKTYAMEAVKTAEYGAGVSFAIAKSQLKKNSNPYNKIKSTEKDKPLYNSSLGTPVFCNFEIQAGQWTEDDLDGFTTTHSWEKQTFDTVLITVDYPKNIIKTIIQGSKRKGSVKEYISDGDFLIDIKLAIIGQPGVMPLQEIADLMNALKAPVPLAINCRYLQNIGIDNIVIENTTIPQVEGIYSSQVFQIKAMSDTPLELLIV